MSEQKTHQLIVLACVFNAFVVLALLIVQPVLGLLWLLAAVLAAMLLAGARPAVWQMEKRRIKGALNRLARRMGGGEEEPAAGKPEYDLVSLRPGDASRWPVDGDTFVIGRGSACACRLHDATVSKEHCRILYRKFSREYYIEDLRSHNGTYLGTRRLEPFTQEKLPEGAELSIGDCRFRFVKRGG